MNKKNVKIKILVKKISKFVIFGLFLPLNLTINFLNIFFWKLLSFWKILVQTFWKSGKNSALSNFFKMLIFMPWILAAILNPGAILTHFETFFSLILFTIEFVILENPCIPIFMIYIWKLHPLQNIPKKSLSRQGLFLDIVVNKEGDVVLYIKSWKLVYRGFQVCRIQWWIVSSWKISQNLSKWRLDSRWPPKSRVWISTFSKNHWELSFCLIFKIFAPKSFKKIVVFTKKYLKNLGWC